MTTKQNALSEPLAEVRGSGGNGAPRRPLCRCHDEPMDRVGPRWACAVKRRARQLAAYHADPEAANYARARRLLRARIGQKRRRIAELETFLGQDAPRGY